MPISSYLWSFPLWHFLTACTHGAAWLFLIFSFFLLGITLFTAIVLLYLRPSSSFFFLFLSSFPGKSRTGKTLLFSFYLAPLVVLSDKEGKRGTRRVHFFPLRQDLEKKELTKFISFRPSFFSFQFFQNHFFVCFETSPSRLHEISNPPTLSPATFMEIYPQTSLLLLN